MKLAQWFTLTILLSLLVTLFFIPQTLTSGFKAGGGGETTVVTGTGIYTSYMTSVDQYGQTTVVGVVTSGTYVATTTQAATTASAITITTTSAGQTTTSTSLGSAWLNIVINGVFKLLDPNGNLITSQTYELATESGSAVGSVALDATYTVQSQGVDLSTLKVDCSASGLTAQPSTADPNTPEVVNTVPVVKAWSGLTTASGHLTQVAPIDTLLGGKTWDHSRKLSASLGVMCTASAKRLPGYELAGGGDTVSQSVGPIVGISTLKWYEAAPVTQQPTPTPTPVIPTTPPTSTTSTVTPTYNAYGVPSCRYGYEYSAGTCVSLSYSQTVAAKTAATIEEKESIFTKGLREQYTARGTAFDLLGIFPLIEVFGATETTGQGNGIVWLWLAAIAITSFAFLYVSLRKKKHFWRKA
jgi:hypothetical protein